MTFDRLLDGDLPCRGGLSLGHDNRENTVLQAGLDSMLIDPHWEGKSAVKLANGALGDPVSVSGLRLLFGDLLLCGLCWSGNSRVTSLVLIFDGWLVRFGGRGIIGGFLDLWLGLVDVGIVVLSLRTTSDHKSMRVGEFNFDVLLANARKLSVQAVAIL